MSLLSNKNLNNPEAEKVVLSCMIQDVSYIAQTRLEKKHFYSNDNGIIFEYLLGLLEKRSEATLASFSEATNLSDDLFYQIQMHTAVPTEKIFLESEDIIIDHYIYRTAIANAQKLIAYCADKKPVEGIDKLINSIIDAPEKDIDDYLYADVMQVFEGEKRRIASTGYQGLDKYIKGFYSGQMLIVGARPGVGKSMFALNLADKMMIQGIPSVFFSSEMGSHEIKSRFLGLKTATTSYEIEAVHENNEDMTTKVMKKVEKLETMKPKADCKLYTKIPNFDYVVRKIHKEASRGSKVFFIDYLQNIRHDITGSNRNIIIGDMSRRLKQLALEYDICIVALAQLNRGSENRVGDQTPRKSDLRDSGELEQDADIVMLLHKQDPEAPLKVIVDKNRNGMGGSNCTSDFMQDNRIFLLQDI